MKPMKPNFDELIQKVRSVLQKGLVEMDFVTREEFETQKQVLLKTRTLLNELEKKIEELEQQSRT
jgi:BMFP domain-containing protein YqiC